MATLRLLPPADGNHPTIKVHGRTYNVPLGSTVDVPEGDAAHMLGNGWINPGRVQAAGATSARPANQPNGARLTAGYTYLDTTLAYIIVFDGLVWRNPATGASV